MRLTFALAFLFLGCATLREPSPDWRPPRVCQSPGRMVEAPHAFFDVARCYACEREAACYLADHYCCADRMCSECEVRPYLLTAPDGGMKGQPS